MPSSACKTSARSEEHTSELQSHDNLVCRLLLEKKLIQDCSDLYSRFDGDPAEDPALADDVALEYSKLRSLSEKMRMSFFFNDAPPTELYLFPQHVPLPI